LVTQLVGGDFVLQFSLNITDHISRVFRNKLTFETRNTEAFKRL